MKAKLNKVIQAREFMFRAIGVGLWAILVAIACKIIGG